MRKYLSGLAALALGVGMAAASTPSQAAMVQFTTPLSGAQEVGGGDPDGSGLATLWLDGWTSMIAWNITVSNITLPTTGAHIHEAPVGVNGPIVIDFNNTLVGGWLSDPDVLRVIANPTNFYVNVHNADFPGGAIRGQIPEPASAALLGLALGVLGWRLRRG